MAQSVVAAAVAKYATLPMTGVTRPAGYFDQVPQTGAGGTVLSTNAGYVNIVDEGTSVEQSPASGFDLEHNPVEVTTLRFEVYGPSLAFVDLVMIGIKYSTGTVTAGLGFDFGTLTITGQQLMECRRTHELRTQEQGSSDTGGYVFLGQIWYSIQAKVD